MRHFIIASHGNMSEGMLDSIEIVSGQNNSVFTVCAFKSHLSYQEEIERILVENPADEWIILTDIVHGSLTQHFLTLTSQYRMKIIAGVNFPLALSLLLIPEDQPIDESRILEEIEMAREHIRYINPSKIIIESEDEIES